jgi:uncharacterized protein YfaS (alpha-2-macroglobulin family)
MAAPSLVKPGQVLPIRLSSREPQQVIVFAVDEGILQAARYRLQNPLDTFFAKRALEVKTSQMLDLILPEFKLLLNRAAAITLKPIWTRQGKCWRATSTPSSAK